MSKKMLPAMIFALCAMSGVIGYLLGCQKKIEEFYSYDGDYDFDYKFPDLSDSDLADDIAKKAQTPEE